VRPIAEPQQAIAIGGAVVAAAMNVKFRVTLYLIG
tara:strand:+ start:91 stop:195 length:105 start_codon:yes stop_codon:yes gene_type:complete